MWFNHKSIGMKNILSLLCILMLTVACVNSPTPERSVGFTDWTDDGTSYKFHLGTDAYVDVVKTFDNAVQARNYPAIREIFNDTASITYQNGVTATIDEFISMNLRRDSILAANNASLKWDLLRAFSVDLDPTTGGEHVNAMYKGMYKDSTETIQYYANLWFYVRDEKIITVNQFNQTIPNDEE